MSKANILEATYIINTPMFLGSVDNTEAEMRPTSFKGMLRFWFRAIGLGEFNGDKNEVARLEGIIFGETISKNSQKALYGLKLKRSNIIKTGKGNKERKLGIIYLGYGLNKYIPKSGNEYIRDYIEPNIEIKILLIEDAGIRKNIREEDANRGRDLLIKSLKAIGIFGGLGSRSRRGFGSLTLMSLVSNDKKIVPIPYISSLEELKVEISDLLEKSKKYGDEIDNIEFTAFSRFTKIVLTKEFKNPMDALDEIGKEMIRYRSYGRENKILNGQDSEKIFTEDHDLVYDYIKSKRINNHPKRVVFGLPHNYRLSTRDNISINSTSRRSSPLFIHIHRMNNDKYIGILTMIPSKFLKDDDSITISSKGKTKTSIKANAEYKVVEDFLARIVKKMSGTSII